MTLVNPHDSELAKRADITDDDHEGFISFSEVQGMMSASEGGGQGRALSLNESGVWRAREVWRRAADAQRGRAGRG